jgi:hypothetical protein
MFERFGFEDVGPFNGGLHTSRRVAKSQRRLGDRDVILPVVASVKQREIDERGISKDARANKTMERTKPRALDREQERASTRSFSYGW